MMKRSLKLSSCVLLAAIAGCTCTKTKEGPDRVDGANEKATLRLPADLSLPRSSATAPPPEEGVTVFVSRTAVAVGRYGAEPKNVVALGDRATLVRDGIDARYKEKAGDLFVVPLAAEIAAVRKALDVSAVAPVLVSIDAATPFHPLADVFLTLQRAKAIRYDLVVRSEGKDDLHVIELGTPDLAMLGGTPMKAPDAGADGGIAPDAPVSLGVRVAAEGIELRAFGKAIGSGCNEGAEGLAVPKAGDGYDFAALRACAVKQKKRAPDSRDALVAISCAPEIDAQTLVRVLDALRTTDDGARLFPGASFTLVH